MIENTLEQVRRIAANVLQTPADRITPSSSPENLTAWDSLQHLNLILAIEERFEMQFDPEELDAMNSIGKIAALLDAKIASNRK